MQPKPTQKIIYLKIYSFSDKNNININKPGEGNRNSLKIILD